MKQTRQLEDKVERYGKMCTTWDDLMTICEMALEENDESMLEELKDGYHKLEEQMETARLETLLSGGYILQQVEQKTVSKRCKSVQ